MPQSHAFRLHEHLHDIFMWFSHKLFLFQILKSSCIESQSNLYIRCHYHHLTKNDLKAKLSYRLFSVVHSNRTRSHGLKPEHRKLRTDRWKNFFIVRVTEHWSRLPRDIVDSLSKNIFKTCLVSCLCNLL